MRRILTVLIVTAALLAVTVLVLQLYGVRINHSASMPVGLYIQDPNGPDVGLCPPDHNLSAERHYRLSGPVGVDTPKMPFACPDGAEHLLKPVAARAGDTVVLDSTGVTVNGTHIPRSAALDHDSDGRPMSAWPPGTYAVGPEQIWVISSYNGRSYDSRYFGPVAVASVRGNYRPLFVFAE